MGAWVCIKDYTDAAGRFVRGWDGRKSSPFVLVYDEAIVQAHPGCFKPASAKQSRSRTEVISAGRTTRLKDEAAPLPADQQNSMPHLLAGALYNLQHSQRHAKRLDDPKVQADAATVKFQSEHINHHQDEAVDHLLRLADAMSTTDSKAKLFKPEWDVVNPYTAPSSAKPNKSASNGHLHQLPARSRGRLTAVRSIAPSSRSSSVGPARVSVRDSIEQQMASMCIPDREAAGLLFSSMRSATSPLIAVSTVSGPGAGFESGGDWHRSDDEHDRRVIAQMRSRELRPIGSWHSHFGSHSPSHADQALWRRQMRAWGLSRHVGLLYVLRRPEQPLLVPWMTIAGRSEPLRVELV